MPRRLTFVAIQLIAFFLSTAVTGQEPTPQAQTAPETGFRASDNAAATPPQARATAPCHCLVRKLFNLPGPNDIYYCLSYDTGVCDDDTAFEESWYGAPSFPLPQDCLASTCEPHVNSRIASPTNRGGTADISHHGMRLVQKRASDDDETIIQADTFVFPMMRSCHAISGTVSAQYFTFQGGEIGANRNIHVMAVPFSIKPSGSEEPKTRYWCTELERINEPTFARKVKVIASRNAQFTVDFSLDEADDAPILRGMIWLQYPKE